MRIPMVVARAVERATDSGGGGSHANSQVLANLGLIVLIRRCWQTWVSSCQTHSQVLANLGLIALRTENLGPIVVCAVSKTFQVSTTALYRIPTISICPTEAIFPA
jgi:hypothetical protein